MKSFSHIYIEKNLIGSSQAKEILDKFPSATVVEIDHYKDVFCRSHQDFMLQKDHQALILAQKNGQLLYEGAKVCQSFGNAHFYYTSQVMNCIYNCEYCYLSGMYPSGNVVMFLNIEDYFAEVKKYLSQHEMYICISYDTDLLALEAITGFLKKWIAFVDENENLTIEIRTKCGALDSVFPALENLKHKERVIFAYTLSPGEITKKYELHTSSLEARIKAIQRLMSLDMQVRLSFDPMIYIPGWQGLYLDLATQVFSAINTSQILDISVGTFRISNEYLKKMRKNSPASAIAQFPYESLAGVYQYPEKIRSKMESFMIEQCEKVIEKEKIFLWKD